MRPVRLTMQAFGSYEKRTVIDFTVPNQNLFLITGDTGAGKTTIFDAIVFALYGEASSTANKKDGAELQSQYADPGVEPFVALTFSQQAGEETQTYTVRRSPRHLRPAKRSGAKAQLVSENVSLTMPDGLEYPPKETDRKLVEIIGLTKGQFMQVAMIAQGEFMELLRADSNKKKEIFRKLFRTEQFAQIVEELSERKKEREHAISDIRTASQQEVGHIVVPEEDEEAAQLNDLKKQLTKSDRLNMAQMEDLLAGLSDLCTRLRQRRQAADQEVAALSEARDRCRDAVTRGEALLKSYAQLEAAQQELERAKARAEEMQSNAVLLSQIESAYEVQAVHQRVEDAAWHVRQTENLLEKQQAALPELTQKYEDAQEKERAAGKNADKQMAAYSKEAERTDRTLKTFQEADRISKRITVLEDAVQQAGVQAQDARTAVTDLEKQEAQWRGTEQELSGAEKELALWQVREQHIREIDGKIVTAEREKNHLDRQQRTARSSVAAYEAARQAHRRKKAEYDRSNEAFLDAQAGLLAQTLRDGEPCPVCGSTSHPHPCRLQEAHLHLTREIIDRLAAETAELEAARSQAGMDANAAGELLEEKRAHYVQTMEALRAELLSALDENGIDPAAAGLPEENTPLRPSQSAVESRAAAPEPPLRRTEGRAETEPAGSVPPHIFGTGVPLLSLDQARHCVAVLKEQLAAAGDVCEENVTRLHSARQSLAGVDERKQKLRSRADEADAAARKAQRDLLEAHTTLENLKKQADYPTRQEALAARSAARELLATVQQAHESAKNEAQAAAASREKARTLIRRAQAELPGQKDTLDERTLLYQKTMREKDLSELEWQSLVEDHQKEEVQELRTVIKTFDQKRDKAQGAIKTAREAIAGREKPDLDALAAKSDEAQARLDEAMTRQERLREMLRTDTSVLKTLGPRMEERRAIVEEYSRIDGLYQRLAGKITGFRMDIETYVQRYYLERILYAANQRFQSMSAGQFELRETPASQAGEGRNRGLDLMVYSAVTGKEREVRTLSGGESFMAALSLALGMADQISAGTAAISLDMMFIDEGFGSLDDHAREQAVRVLQQMAGGSKLIGIISHVTELKTEIEDQLIVAKDDHGSHVHWQIS